MVGLGGFFVSGKSVGGLNCFCPCLPKGCSPYIPPVECCPRFTGCKPTGEIIYGVDGNLLSWKPSPCEFCSCIIGKPQCAIQDYLAPYCENYVTVKEDVVQYALQETVNQLVTYFLTAMVSLVGDLILVPTVSMVMHPSCAICDCAALSCPNYVILEGELPFLPQQSAL